MSNEKNAKYKESYDTFISGLEMFINYKNEYEKLVKGGV